MNELHERKRALNKRLAEIEKERERALKLPAITEAMIDDVLTRVYAMFELTEHQELKAALARFIERIEINGQDITIQYTFAKPVSTNVPSIGDPGGIGVARATFQVLLV